MVVEAVRAGSGADDWCMAVEVDEKNLIGRLEGNT